MRHDAGEPGPVLNARGERVALGPLRQELLPLYWRWINDPTVMRGVGAYRPLTTDQERAWYDAQQDDEGTMNFTIYELPDHRPVGTTALAHIDLRHGTAEFGILIGEPDARGRGYGTEATRLVLRHAFDAVGLHSVVLGVYSFNEVAIRAYRRAGFREIGRRREAHLLDGRRWDEVWMECLAPEFRAR